MPGGQFCVVHQCFNDLFFVGYMHVLCVILHMVRSHSNVAYEIAAT